MATNSQFLFSVIVFYGFLLVLLHFYGNSLYDIEDGVNTFIADLESKRAEAGFWESIWLNIGIFVASVSAPLMPIYMGVSALPFWFNAILFTPILIISIWIVVITIIPGVSDA